MSSGGSQPRFLPEGVFGAVTDERTPFRPSWPGALSLGDVRPGDKIVVHMDLPARNFHFAYNALVLSMPGEPQIVPEFGPSIWLIRDFTEQSPEFLSQTAPESPYAEEWSVALLGLAPFPDGTWDNATYCTRYVE